MKNALRLIYSGERYFPAQVYDMLTQIETRVERLPVTIKRASGKERVALERPELFMATLSPRENRVLALLLNGLSNKEIASVKGVSVGTAKNYVASALRVCGVKNRGALLVSALSGEMTKLPLRPR